MPKYLTHAFDAVASQYQLKALLQHRAAKKLLNLLQPLGYEDIIDIGCGPGQVTDVLKSLTTGRVLGTDISAGMLEEARAQYHQVEFQQIAAEDLEYHEVFDLAFCNSAFCWFQQPQMVVQAMLNLLRSGGRLGVATPSAWPTFSHWVDRVRQHPEFAQIITHWQNPWFVLPDIQSYQALFEHAGFITRQAEIVEEVTGVKVEQAYQIYLSGANVGYTQPMYYTQVLPEMFSQTWERLIRQEIVRDAVDDQVRIVVKRLYYIGAKP